MSSNLNICVINAGNTLTNYVELFKTIDETVVVHLLDIADADQVKLISPLDGIILTGSSDLKTSDTVNIPADLLDIGIPVIGVSYGFYWMVAQKGGIVNLEQTGLKHDFNKYIVISKPFQVSLKKYMFSHREYVDALPNNWINVLTFNNEVLIAYEEATKHLGVHFQPELNKSTSLEFYKGWLNWIKKEVFTTEILQGSDQVQDPLLGEPTY